MNRIIFLIFINLMCCYSDYKSNPNELTLYVKHHLAISINPNCNSQYVNYAVVTESSGKIIKTRFITVENLF